MYGFVENFSVICFRWENQQNQTYQSCNLRVMVVSDRAFVQNIYDFLRCLAVQTAVVEVVCKLQWESYISGITFCQNLVAVDVQVDEQFKAKADSKNRKIVFLGIYLEK